MNKVRVAVTIVLLITPGGTASADAPQADSLMASTFFGGSSIDGYLICPCSKQCLDVTNIADAPAHRKGNIQVL